jgi:hypothetical protein
MMCKKSPDLNKNTTYAGVRLRSTSQNEFVIALRTTKEDKVYCGITEEGAVTRLRQSKLLISITKTAHATGEHVTSSATLCNNRRAAGSGIATLSVRRLRDVTIAEIFDRCFLCGPCRRSLEFKLVVRQSSVIKGVNTEVVEDTVLEAATRLRPMKLQQTEKT